MVSVKVSASQNSSDVVHKNDHDEMRDDSDDGVDDQGTPVTSADGRVLTASQKKYLKRKIREKEKKAKLANSAVRELPEDPVEPLRVALLDSLTSELEHLPSLKDKTHFEILSDFPEQRKLLETFQLKIKDEVASIQAKTLKPLIRAYDIDTLVQEIQEKEMKEPVDKDAINFRLEELKRHVSARNQQEFIDATNILSDKVSLLLKKNEELFNKAVDANRKDAIVDKLSNLRQIEDPNSEPLTAAQVLKVIVDIDPVVSSALFYPQNVSRKLESQFCVVIEKPRTSSTSQGGMTDERRTRIQNPRVAEVWGTESDVEKVVKLLKNGNFSGQLKKSVDKNMLPAIIGKAGTGIRKLEHDNSCVVLIEDTNVVVLGTDQSAEAVFSTIDAMKAQRQVDQLTLEVVVEPLLARALLNIHSSKIRNIENDFKANIKVSVNSNTGIGTITVRCKAAETENIKKALQKEIVEPFAILIFTSSGRAINRLLFPPKGIAPEQTRAIPNEFRSLRDALSVYATKLTRNDEFKNSTAAIHYDIPDPSIVADNERNKDNEDRAVLSTEPVHLGIVCAKVDVPTVESKLKELFKRACRMSARIPIDRDQLRIFTPENRALVEESTGCGFSVNTSAGDRSMAIVLHGTLEQIERGKSVVNDIFAREGFVREIIVQSPETVMELIRNRGAKIQSLETEYRVSISVKKETKSVRIVGFESMVKDVIDLIKKMDETITTAQERTETKTMTISARNLPRLIGRSGQMLSQIRSETGIIAIRTPSEADRTLPDGTLAEEVSISIVGEPACIQSAVTMIEQLMARVSRIESGANDSNEVSDKGPLTTSWTGRGRGRGAPAEPRNANSIRETRGGRGRGGSNSNWVGLTNDDGSSYPALGSAWDTNMESQSPFVLVSPDSEENSNSSPVGLCAPPPSFAAMTANASHMNKWVNPSETSIDVAVDDEDDEDEDDEVETSSPLEL